MKVLKLASLPFASGLPFATAALSASIALVSPVNAQEFTGQIEEMVLTGTRGKPRTVTDSPVPVDVFGIEDLKSVSYTDTNDILQTLVPSYSVGRQPISDGGTFIRTASLRGMPTDKTLVLVNGKRRHRAALVQIGASGSQGPDVATIPASALSGVEVLRDGAASLYGSDAIAGVINFKLKDNSEGGSISLNVGEHYEGDGQEYVLTGNVGFGLGSDGFFSLSGEISSADFTSRSEQYCEPWFCVTDQSEEYQEAARSASLEGDVVQPWGQPNSEAIRLFFNAGLPIGDSAELYSFGNYSESEGDGSFFYRYPGNGTIEELRNEDGSIYTPLDRFPGGFTPRFSGEVTDYSFLAGIRGSFSDALTYDFSGRYGYDEISYTLENTINPSMGIDSPTSFKPGDLSNEELQLQGDFVLEVSDAVTLAFGASYMEETYDVMAGEEASYLAGDHARSDPFGFCDGTAPTAAGLTVIPNGSTLDCAETPTIVVGGEEVENPNMDPVYRVVGVGSNGFPGYSPDFSDTYERDSFGVYAELSADITDSFFVQSSLRYEDYSDFDSELVGQVAAKYNITDSFGLRGSVGTGFRAPTPGQQGTTNVSTRLPDGLPVATGLFPAGGVVAQALGAEELKPETSTSATFGFTSEIGGTSLTVDFYQIKIEDRTYAASTLGVSTNPDDGDDFDRYIQLRDAGVEGAESIGGVFYFANAFNSTTRGVDIVSTTPLEWDDGSTTTITASFNYNKSEIDEDPQNVINVEDTFDFENATPDFRGVITARHQMDTFSVTARANYFGSYEDSNAPGSLFVGEPTTIQKYGEEFMFDLEASLMLNDTWSLTAGARNIFDEYPDKAERDDAGFSDYCCGRVYSSNTIVPWQGGFYFFRVDANF